MRIDKNVFADRIKKLRHRRNLTQEQLAEMTELSVVYISNVECAKRIPSLDTMLALCNALDCSPDELLEGFFPEKDKHQPFQLKAVFEHCEPSEMKFLLKVCAAFMQYLKDSTK